MSCDLYCRSKNLAGSPSRSAKINLHLLAQGAALCATDRGQAFVLFQRACALLWRLEPTGQPISPIELERKLRTPLEDWLPESVRADYSGPSSTSTLSRKPAVKCCWSSMPRQLGCALSEAFAPLYRFAGKWANSLEQSSSGFEAKE